MRSGTQLVLAAIIMALGTAQASAQDGPDQEAPMVSVQQLQAERGSSPVADSLVSRAERLMGEGDFESALGELDAAIAIQPDHVWAWANRGNALAMLNRMDEAVDAFAQADAIEPGNPVTLSGQGYVALNRQDAARALELFGLSLAAQPDNPFAHYYRGTAYAMMEQFEEALADFDRALELSPQWSLPYPMRAFMLIALDRDAEALEAVEGMLAAFPDNPFVQTVASDLLLQLNHDDRANAMLAEALDSDAPSAAALLSSAQRREVDETDIKLEELDQALELAPDFVRALYERADTLWLENRLPEALADIDRVLELQPRLWQALNLRGTILFDMGRDADAARMATELAEQFPDVPNALATAISLFTAVNYITRAGEVREALKAIAPDHPMAREMEPGFVRAN